MFVHQFGQINLVKLITSTCLNLVEHVIKHVEFMFKPHVSFNIPIKPIYVQHVKIVIPPNTFQQHLPKMFFQLEVGKMEIDKTFARIRVQNLCTVGWIVTKEEQLTKVNLGYNMLKSMWICNLLSIIN